MQTKFSASLLQSLVSHDPSENDYNGLLMFLFFNDSAADDLMNRKLKRPVFIKNQNICFPLYMSWCHFWAIECNLVEQKYDDYRKKIAL